jgi:hypothetical protein
LLDGVPHRPVQIESIVGSASGPIAYQLAGTGELADDAQRRHPKRRSFLGDLLEGFGD